MYHYKYRDKAFNVWYLMIVFWFFFFGNSFLKRGQCFEDDSNLCCTDLACVGKKNFLHLFHFRYTKKEKTTNLQIKIPARYNISNNINDILHSRNHLKTSWRSHKLPINPARSLIFPFSIAFFVLCLLPVLHANDRCMSKLQPLILTLLKGINFIYFLQGFIV